MKSSSEKSRLASITRNISWKCLRTSNPKRVSTIKIAKTSTGTSRNNQALVEDIAKDIPPKYDAKKWEAYNLGDNYRKLEKAKDQNSTIERAKAFKGSYDNKVRGIKADRDIAISAEEKQIANERENLKSTIERLKAEIKAAEDKVLTLDDKLSDKVKVIEAEYQTKLAKLDKDTEVANEWADREPTDVTELDAEIRMAEEMKKHLNEYSRMVIKQDETERLVKASEDLTAKIELARELPGEILKNATIPIDGLTVQDGIPLIHGLPISNLSDGELLELCVDVTVNQPGQLQIILVDGAERLDTDSRERLYKKCKERVCSSSLRE